MIPRLDRVSICQQILVICFVSLHRLWGFGRTILYFSSGLRPSVREAVNGISSPLPLLSEQESFVFVKLLRWQSAYLSRARQKHARAREKHATPPRGSFPNPSENQSSHQASGFLRRHSSKKPVRWAMSLWFSALPLPAATARPRTSSRPPPLPPYSRWFRYLTPPPPLSSCAASRRPRGRSLALGRLAVSAGRGRTQDFPCVVTGHSNIILHNWHHLGNFQSQNYPFPPVTPSI